MEREANAQTLPVAADIRGDSILDLRERHAAARFDSNLHRVLVVALSAIALVYALLAGLRTVSDYDIGWQLASGRWMVQHQAIFATDVFSYTAYGQPWIYPVGAGLLFYGVFLLGGYALLSWVGAAACAGTVALLLRRGSLTTAVLAIIAVPLVAYRTIPRADMFTVVLFAAYLSILWEHHQTGRGALWLLPLLMLAWVNVHLGFIAGIGLVGAFAGIELLEMLFGPERQKIAAARLRSEWPWFVATIAATLLNPWGWGIFRALVRQDRAMAQHAQYLTEWFGLPLSWPAISSSLSLRDTQGAVYVVLAIAIVAALAAAWQRRIGAALLLLAAGYESVKHIRMEALMACVVVLVGGSVLHSLFEQLQPRLQSAGLRNGLVIAVSVGFAGVACLHVADLVSNRRYLVRNEVATFGAGPGWWYPERAAEFIARANLPGEILNTYDEGGYFLWKLGNQHRDYIDGRAIPFGTSGFQQQEQLLHASLDSSSWQRTAERYNVNVFLLPLSRLHLTPMMRLKDFCNSRNWRPVYLDEVAAVFVRRTPQTEEFLRRAEVDCGTAALPAQPVSSSPAIAFNQWANAAGVLSALGRSYEALAATDKAQQMFPDSGYVHWLRGNLFAGMGRTTESEAEFLKAVDLDPSENTWSSLGMLYSREGRHSDANQALQQAVRLSQQPYLANLRLAHFYLGTADPQLALQALDEAQRQAPASALAETGPQSLPFQAARARAEAWSALGNLDRATEYAEDAVRAAPDDADAWSDLAKLYGQDSRPSDQERAEKRAAELHKFQTGTPTNK